MNGLNLTSLIKDNLFLLMVMFKASINYCVPQSSIFEPLLSLIYISDLNHAIKFCKVHHFTDDTNLIHFSKSVNKLHKYINIDMEILTNLLSTNKISLNVKKLN